MLKIRAGGTDWYCDSSKEWIGKEKYGTYLLGNQYGILHKN